jgi:hypothetical protein
MMNIGVVAGTHPAEAVRSSVKNIQKISETEHLQRARQRAMSLPEFCRRYGPGRTLAYQEINSGRLRARKVKKRTIITEDDAEEWLRQLPIVPKSR